MTDNEIKMLKEMLKTLKEQNEILKKIYDVQDQVLNILAISYDEVGLNKEYLTEIQKEGFSPSSG